VWLDDILTRWFPTPLSRLILASCFVAVAALIMPG
jgi:hypothetical protein